MILIAGGTGRLGKILVRSLTDQGRKVRTFSRHGNLARTWQNPLVEAVSGDVRDPREVGRAVVGADTVVSAVQGFSGAGGTTPQSVDLKGNLNLFRASQSSGVKKFILLSIVGASESHPLELFRMKYLAERELKKNNDLSWTIIRCTAFMETWMELLLGPLLKTGKTRIFGSGNNPINFVSAYDVAQYIARAICDETMIDQTINVGGPENVTFLQIVNTYEEITGKNATIARVPQSVMKLLSAIASVTNPTLARKIRTAIWMDTSDMRFEAKETVFRYPEIALTKISDAIRREYGKLLTEPNPLRLEKRA